MHIPLDLPMKVNIQHTLPLGMPSPLVSALSLSFHRHHRLPPVLLSLLATANMRSLNPGHTPNLLLRSLPNRSASPPSRPLPTPPRPTTTLRPSRREDVADPQAPKIRTRTPSSRRRSNEAAPREPWTADRGRATNSRTPRKRRRGGRESPLSDNRSPRHLPHTPTSPAPPTLTTPTSPSTRLQCRQH